METNLDAAHEGDPYDPEKLTERALEVMRDEIHSKLEGADAAMRAGKSRLQQFKEDFNQIVKIRDLLRKGVEALGSTTAEMGNTADFLAEIAAKGELMPHLQMTAKATLELINYYMNEGDRLKEIAAKRGEMNSIYPAVKWRVRRAKAIAAIVRSTTLLLGLGATIVVELLLSAFVESEIALVLPTYAKVLAIAVLYGVGLAFIERPLDNWQNGRFWTLFHQIMRKKAEALNQISELEAELAALASRSARASSW